MMIKKCLISLLFTLFSANSFANNNGLPPKTDSRENQIDCGTKTESNLDRTLEKSGPELAMGESSVQKKDVVTVGFTGSTVLHGANISDENLSKLIIGKTQYQDVVNLLGEPGAVRRDDFMFVAQYNFIKNENKLDPKTFIPVFGSLLAKQKANYFQRTVILNYDPTGILISCTKKDTQTSSTQNSAIDQIKKLNVQ